MKSFKLIVLILIFSLDLKAADSSIVSLSVSNIYAFKGLQHCHGSMNDSVTSYIVQIVSDTTIDGQRYFKFYSSKELPWERYANVMYYRADSSRIFKYNLEAAKEDTILNFNDSVGTVYSSGEAIILKDKRYLLGSDFLYVQMYSASYASKLFLVDYFIGSICEEDIELKSALIDGVFYGDTTLLSVSASHNNNFPHSILYQNYPNPFNSKTRIEFFNPHIDYLSLKVYDVLGRTVITLIGGITESGYQKVDFDASILPSGIYLYSLEDSKSIQTKKLILLK